MKWIIIKGKMCNHPKNLLCLFSPSFSMNGLFKKKINKLRNRNKFILIKIVVVGIFIVIVSGIGIGIGIIIYTTITRIPHFVVHLLDVEK